MKLANFRANVLEKTILFLLLALLPSQLGRHFWPDWSLINGIRVDYLSPTIYLTDLLILALVIITPPYPPLNLRGGIKGGVMKLLVAVFVAVNVLSAFNPLLATYKWLRVYEYFWLYRFLVERVSWGQIRTGLGLAVIWTTALAGWQLVIQRSVGGWWYWLGERTFSIVSPGIAKVFIPSLGLVLRPYSVLPHPNALAGWLLVAGLLVGGWKQIISLFGVLISFSRSAILLSPLILWKRSKFLVVALLITGYMLFANLGNPTSLAERQVLNQKALEVITQAPVFGVGLGNFVYFVPTIRQPVHNIYLLLASEIGLPAAMVIGFWIIRSFFQISNFKLKIAFLSVLLTGMADHYWLSLHQTTLLLVILLAAVKIRTSEIDN